MPPEYGKHGRQAIQLAVDEINASGAYLLASKPYKRYMCIGPGYSYGHSSWNMFKAKLKELNPNPEIDTPDSFAVSANRK